MSLFGPSIPKGITKSELPNLRGRLLGGHGGENISKILVERIMELVDMAMDSDSYAERANNVHMVDAKEAERIEKNLENNLTPAQRAYVHKAFAEYVAQNKSPSIF